MRLLSILGITVGLGLAAMAGAGWWAMHAPLPDHERDVTVEGLRAPVEIRRDRWGIPHITAETLEDLVFGQGFVHAQDRAWTMLFYRAVARGELAGLIGGADALENDVLMRSLGFADLAAEDYAALDDRTRAVLDAFTAGVNAYLSTRSPKRLAAEFALLDLGGLDPEIAPWRPEDSLAVGKLMGFSLSGRDITREILREHIAVRVSPQMYAQWLAPYPYEEHPTVIKSADRAGVAPSPARHAVLGPSAPANAKADAGLPSVLRNPILNGLPGMAASHGSNAWVVSGAHTKSGAPMLAVDSHVGIEIPNVWHEIGLHLRPRTGQSFDIQGFAAAPFFLVLEGSNTHAAWGTTNVSGGDALDLYALTIDPKEPDRYLWDGGWETMTTREVVIPRADAQEPHRTVVRATHFGPVLPLSTEDEGGPVYAVRWGGFDASFIARASVRLPFIESFEEMRDVLREWDYPPTNFFFAGRDGTIGFQQAGRFPVRAAGSDGARPQDGSSAASAWLGFLPYERMPWVKDPASGILVSGNNPSVPPSYFDQINARTGGDADYLKDAARGYRAARIETLLARSDEHTLDSFSAIQTDTTTHGLGASMSVFAALPVGESQSACRDVLAGWTGSFAADSAGALVFAHVWDAIVREVQEPHLGDDVTLSVGMTELLFLQTILEDAGSGWWDDPATGGIEARDERLAPLVSRVCADLRKEFGPKSETWRWDAVHKAHFIHPVFAASGLPLIEGWGNAGPFKTGGGVGTPNVGRWSPARGDHTARHIPSYRRIVDVSDMASVRSINSVGQSSHPASAHYADQAPLWAEGLYKEPAWGDEEIAAVTTKTMRLVPAEPGR